jgi:hypothetical protein
MKTIDKLIQLNEILKAHITFMDDDATFNSLELSAQEGLHHTLLKIREEVLNLKDELGRELGIDSTLGDDK